MRGFVMEGDYDEETGEETLKSRIRREMVEKLASEWNEYHSKIEQRGWMDEEQRANEADYHAEMASEEAYNAEEKALKANPNLSAEEIQDIREKAEDAYYEAKKKRDHMDHDRIEVIEELLSELGARMMRPYEHWNEDERMMEYMENRYD